MCACVGEEEEEGEGGMVRGWEGGGGLMWEKLEFDVNSSLLMS